MFKRLRDRLSKVQEEAAGEMLEADPTLKLDYEDFEVADEKGAKIKAKHLDNLLWELELALMESDVSVDVVTVIKDQVEKELLGIRVGSRKEIAPTIEKALKSALVRVLSAQRFNPRTLLKRTEEPLAIMFVGVNGTGKTTTIAKIANWLLANDRSVVLAACDTFRAGAIEQLTIHAERLDLKIIKHRSGGDPAAVAYDAVEHARAKGKDVVLIDTAGRMQTNTNLMDEMRKMKRVAGPDLIFYVGDALAGNDAVEQASQFNAAVGVDGVVLSKVDVDAKGGAALSIAHAVGKPIAFIGLGQEYDDLMPFDAAWLVERIFASR